MTNKMAGPLLLMALLAGCSRETATTEPSTPATGVEVKDASGKTVRKSGTTSNAASNGAPSAPAARETVIAAGTSLTVRTTNSLSTKTVKPGDTFEASLEESLRSGDRVLAPKGAVVEGRIVESDPGGRVDGRARIAVQLSELQAGGRTLRITTNTIVREAKATKTKDATKIGIGSGVGAAIGAIAGGGKGAAIGAAAGAAAGTGVVVATRGDPAVIPSESVLIFELRSPLTIP